jgi:hypothetical protein
VINIDIVEAGKTMGACRVLGMLPESIESGEDYGLHVTTYQGVTAVSLSNGVDILERRGFAKAMQALADHYGATVVVACDPGVGSTVTAKMIGTFGPSEAAKVCAGCATTDDVHFTDCKVVVYTRQPKAAQTRQDAYGAVESAAVKDLFERALSLGYDQDAAARVADCFTNWDMISDPCATHPNCSMTVDGQGFASDGCEACKVIQLSTDAGYGTTAEAVSTPDSSELTTAAQDVVNAWDAWNAVSRGKGFAVGQIARTSKRLAKLIGFETTDPIARREAMIVRAESILSARVPVLIHVAGDELSLEPDPALADLVMIDDATTVEQLARDIEADGSRKKPEVANVRLTAAEAHAAIEAHKSEVYRATEYPYAGFPDEPGIRSAHGAIPPFAQQWDGGKRFYDSTAFQDAAPAPIPTPMRGARKSRVSKRGKMTRRQRARNRG